MSETYMNAGDSERLIKDVFTRGNESEKRLKAELETAKKKRPSDKEEFSIDAFMKFYDLTNDNGDLNVSPKAIENLEIQYYLTYRNLKTMEEFAKFREDLDAYNVV